MRKKILVAEKSDAIRSIAESILYQNGYEVLSASSLDKAKEQIISAQPNMVIIGADLKDADGKYLYDLLEENENTSSIPLLLIADPSGRSLAYPEEVILPRPFDPKDFLERVKLFVGGGIEASDEEKIQTQEPFSPEAIDEEFLDAALGIDRIEVEDSEEMNKTGMFAKRKRKEQTGEKDIFEIHRPEHGEDDKLDDSNRVESLMIRDENQPSDTSKKKKEEFSASSKIEIKADQYGLMESEPTDEPEMTDTEASHDYDWFLKEMQKVTKEAPLKESIAGESVSPPPSSKTLPGKADAGKKPDISSGGVDKFISEFKEDAKQIGSEPVDGPAVKKAESKSPTVVAVKEKIDRKVAARPETGIDPAEIRHFVNSLVELISEKLAKKIVDKIDKDKLYRIVKDDLAKLISQRK